MRNSKKAPERVEKAKKVFTYALKNSTIFERVLKPFKGVFWAFFAISPPLNFPHFPLSGERSVYA